MNPAEVLVGVADRWASAHRHAAEGDLYAARVEALDAKGELDAELPNHEPGTWTPGDRCGAATRFAREAMAHALRDAGAAAPLDALAALEKVALAAILLSTLVPLDGYDWHRTLDDLHDAAEGAIDAVTELEAAEGGGP